MVLKSNRYYRRTNSGADPMTEAEVSKLYQRRQEQLKRLEELYAPLYNKLKEEISKVGEKELQSFHLFLPRIFKEERFLLYDMDVLRRLEKILSETQDFPHALELVGEFRHFYYGNSGDYHDEAPNVWIHPSGGILIIGYRFDYERYNRGELPKDYVWWIDKCFDLAQRIYTIQSEDSLEISTLLYFIGIGDWYTKDFLQYYPDKYDEFSKARFLPSSSYHGDQPRGGEPNITIKRNISLWQLRDENLQTFLKKDYLVELKKKLGL